MLIIITLATISEETNCAPSLFQSTSLPPNLENWGISESGNIPRRVLYHLPKPNSWNNLLSTASRTFNECLLYLPTESEVLSRSRPIFIGLTKSTVPLQDTRQHRTCFCLGQEKLQISFGFNYSKDFSHFSSRRSHLVDKYINKYIHCTEFK